MSPLLRAPLEPRAWRLLAPRAWSLLAALLLTGCPNFDQGVDGGSDAGPQSIGDQCTQVYTALCNYAINSCGVGTTLSDCIASDMADCPCTGSGCNAASPQASTQVSLCTEEIQSEDCSAVVENQVPMDCLPFTTQGDL